MMVFTRRLERVALSLVAGTALGCVALLAVSALALFAPALSARPGPANLGPGAAWAGRPATWLELHPMIAIAAAGHAGPAAAMPAVRQSPPTAPDGAVIRAAAAEAHPADHTGHAGHANHAGHADPSDHAALAAPDSPGGIGAHCMGGAAAAGAGALSSARRTAAMSLPASRPPTEWKRRTSRRDVPVHPNPEVKP